MARNSESRLENRCLSTDDYEVLKEALVGEVSSMVLEQFPGQWEQTREGLKTLVGQIRSARVTFEKECPRIRESLKDEIECHLSELETQLIAAATNYPTVTNATRRPLYEFIMLSYVREVLGPNATPFELRGLFSFSGGNPKGQGVKLVIDVMTASLEFAPSAEGKAKAKAKDTDSDSDSEAPALTIGSVQQNMKRITSAWKKARKVPEYRDVRITTGDDRLWIES